MAAGLWKIERLPECRPTRPGYRWSHPQPDLAPLFSFLENNGTVPKEQVPVIIVCRSSVNTARNWFSAQVFLMLQKKTAAGELAFVKA
jgi:hypothetical protein